MNNYVDEVLRHIMVDKKTRKRIKEDLINRIDEAMDHDAYFDPYVNMGDPKEVADEFKENLDTMYPNLNVRYITTTPMEYTSEKKIFGLPVVHINTGGYYNTKHAKGIIAIGDTATGFIAIGGVSIGVISIGGVSIGLAAIGGVAIGGFALGGVALGGLALGAVSYGLVKSFGAVTFLKSVFTFFNL